MPNGTPRETRNGGGWGIGILIIIIALIVIGWGWGWGGWGGGGWWHGSHAPTHQAANTNNNGTPTKTLDNNGTAGISGTAKGPANNGAPAH